MKRSLDVTLGAAVLGAGQCFRKMVNGIRPHFKIQAIYDPNPQAVGLAALLPDEEEQLVRTEEELFDRLTRLDVLFVLSPPKEHVRQVCQASTLNKPVFVEKPLAIDEQGLELLEAALERNPRIYFSDFYTDVRAASLVKAFGRRPERTRWIEPFLIQSEWTPLGDTLRTELGEIQAVKGSIVERSVDPYGIPPREWLCDPIQGGVLLDLSYHLLNLYLALFDAPVFVEECRLVCARPTAAETEAFLVLRSTSGVRVELFVGNQCNYERHEFHVRGSRGEVVMDFGRPERQSVLFINVADKMRSAKLSVHYWDLVALGFFDYLARELKAPHGLEEGKGALKSILEAKQLASPVGSLRC